MRIFALILVLGGFACAQVPQSSHIWLITEENHSYEEVVGNSSMPYYNSLIPKYALATQYYSNQHSSLPALMWLVAGQFVTEDNNTTSCFDVDNVVREILAKGLTWKSYQEDLPYAGFQGLTSGNYVRRHNPLIDFTDACTSQQQLNSVPFSQLAVDIANDAVPNYVYITPNLQDDAHDGTLAQADQWLSQQVPAILARSEFQPGGDGILFITFDESDLANDNRCTNLISNGCGGRVATLIIGPQVRPGFQSGFLYAPQNLLRTVCDALAFTTCPDAGAQAVPMLDVFNTVSITSPFANAAVSSPVNIKASTNNSSTVYSMQLYVDNNLQYQANSSSVNTSLPMSSGTHYVVAQSWDTAGGIHKRVIYVTVQSESVVVTSPAPNAVVASPVQIAAVSGGASTVYSTQIYVDNALKYQVSSNSVNTSLSMTNGSHYVVVQAWDKSGGITKNGFYITVSNPTITVSSPAPNSSVYNPVQITASTLDASPVYAVQLYVDNVLEYQNSGTGVNWPLTMGIGTHNLVVQAWDTAGGIYKQSVPVTVQSVPVTITKPANNASVSSPVTIQASVPSNSNVYTMQIYVDNVLQYAVSGTSVNTALSMSSGPHYIVAQAWQTGGAIFKTGINITVK